MPTPSLDADIKTVATLFYQIRRYGVEQTLIAWAQDLNIVSPNDDATHFLDNLTHREGLMVAARQVDC